MRHKTRPIGLSWKITDLFQQLTTYDVENKININSKRIEALIKISMELEKMVRYIQVVDFILQRVRYKVTNGKVDVREWPTIIKTVEELATYIETVKSDLEELKLKHMALHMQQ